MTDDLRATLTTLAEGWEATRDRLRARARADSNWSGDKMDRREANTWDVAAEQLRALLAPAPASEPLSPGAKVSLPSKAAQSPGSETACEACVNHDPRDRRDHGHLTERLFPAPPSETARDAIERDLWWGHLCPALANIGALKEAQRELMALGTDWAQAGRILSRVQSFYVDAAHRAAQRYLEATTPAPTPPTTEGCRVLTTVRLTENELRDVRKAFDRDKWASEFNSLPTAVERIVAARQSDPDATERVEWGVRWGDGDGEMVAEYAGEAVCRRLTRPTDTVVRRTVTTGAWTEVGE